MEKSLNNSEKGFAPRGIFDHDSAKAEFILSQAEGLGMTDNVWWRFVVFLNSMQELTFLGQVLLAIVLGGVLGFQRERYGKPAGPRTYALVTAGAALFTIMSIYGFAGADTSRVASNIVVGIGFLGAGLIFHKEQHIENLTTAAGLWMAAAVGMAVGAAYYFLAVGSTALMLLLFMVNDSRFKKQKPPEGGK